MRGFTPLGRLYYPSHQLLLRSAGEPDDLRALSGEQSRGANGPLRGMDRKESEPVEAAAYAEAAPLAEGETSKRIASLITLLSLRRNNFAQRRSTKLYHWRIDTNCRQSLRKQMLAVG